MVKQNKEAQIVVRLTKDLKDRLQDKAIEKGLTMSALVSIYISNGLTADSSAKDLSEAVKMALQNPEYMQKLIEALQTKIEI